MAVPNTARKMTKRRNVGSLGYEHPNICGEGGGGGVSFFYSGASEVLLVASCLLYRIIMLGYNVYYHTTSYHLFNTDK